MGVSLSIKDVPEDLAQRLRARAAANHRSLQRELMAIIETAAAAWAGMEGAPRRLPASAVLAPLEPLVVPAREDPPVYSVLPGRGPDRDGQPAGAEAGDDLLAELDAIVAGSRWGDAPLLTRAQRHDRRLVRELDFDTRQAEAAAAGPAADPASGREP